MKRILGVIISGIALGYVCSYSFDSFDIQKDNAVSLFASEASLAMHIPKTRLELDTGIKNSSDPEIIFQTALKLIASKSDTHKAIQLFKMAASRGHISAQREYAIWMLSTSNKPPDILEAKNYLQTSAENGDAKAASVLGLLYSSGRVGLSDYKESKYWLKIAAEKGQAEAEHNLALQYLEGRGVAPSFEDAAYWFEKAADQGVKESLVALASLYAEGKGVALDERKAKYLLEKAAVQGSSDASFKLAMLYLGGRGDDEKSDTELAIKWFTAAANTGHAGAKQELLRLRSVAADSY